MISGQRPDKLPFNFLLQYVSKQLVLPPQSWWQRKALSDGGGNITWLFPSSVPQSIHPASYTGEKQQGKAASPGPGQEILHKAGQGQPDSLEKGKQKTAMFVIAVLLTLPVCFIQNQHLNTAQVERRAVVEMINQSPRSCNKNVWPRAQSSFLSLHIQATWKRGNRAWPPWAHCSRVQGFACTGQIAWGMRNTFKTRRDPIFSISETDKQVQHNIGKQDVKPQRRSTITIQPPVLQNSQFCIEVYNELYSSHKWLNTHLLPGKLWHCWTVPAVLWQSAPEYPVLVSAPEPVHGLLEPDEVCKSGARGQATWRQLFYLKKNQKIKKGYQVLWLANSLFLVPCSIPYLSQWQHKHKYPFPEDPLGYKPSESGLVAWSQELWLPTKEEKQLNSVSGMATPGVQYPELGSSLCDT